jgi:hypothetical protein
MSENTPEGQDFKFNPFEGMQDAVEVGPEEDEAARPEYVEPEATEDENGDTVDADEAVPSGTTKEVTDWVGDDKDRAQRALDAEEAKGDDGRVGLKRELNKVLED